ncbi:hypothetical protein DFH06DRAFT_1128158 [Mycena polygramma]|nr:hypothetical protein DFH06DRAFT_1128158 [Mycena polygramma]
MPGAHSSIFIPYSPSASPVTRKRARLVCTPSSSLPATPTRRSVPALPHSPYRFNANNEVVDNPSPPVSSQPVFAPTIPAATVSLPQAGADASAMQHAMDALEARSHLIRQAVAAEEQSDKETAATYARQIRSYEAWWILSQARLLQDDAAHVVIPAFPITAAKVTVYLEYETTRPQKRKRKDDSESTGTIGISGVKQVVSALENWRFSNQHKYLDVPAAQVGLRLDIRIKTFESAAAHTAGKRHGRGFMAFDWRGTNTCHGVGTALHRRWTILFVLSYLILSWTRLKSVFASGENKVRFIVAQLNLLLEGPVGWLSSF